jgi:hypothetical protein
VIFEKKHYSLTVGKPLRLTDDDTIILESDNPKIICLNGMVYANTDVLSPNSKATITAKNNLNKVLDTCEITIVSWIANGMQLETTGYIGEYTAIIEVEGWLYGFASNLKVYCSRDGFNSITLFGTSNIFPKGKILKTPFGYFARDNSAAGKVYRSDDLLNWELCFESAFRGLYHSFDCHVSGETVYIYLGEYTTVNSNRHKVYRGTITSKTNQIWETVLEFKSVDEFNNDEVLTGLYARHIHVVQVDSYTGDVYVNVGDSDVMSKHLISQDNGNTWRAIGEGSQQWRSLSFWFTKDYIYWNMDTSTAQSIFRLKRTYLDLQTPETDYREKVGDFIQGSMWYHAWAKDINGDDVVIMGVSAEGEHRDWKARLLMINERKNKVVVSELFLTPSATPDIYVPLVQLEPLFQDKLGNIYFNSRSLTPVGIWKMRFKSGFNFNNYIFKNPFSI